MAVDRRELIQILGAGVAATSAASAQEQTAPYSPRALSAARYANLERLLELLLPADESSPSARDAGVARYIDTTLHDASDGVKSAWQNALDVLTADNLARVAEDETNPNIEAARLFVMFKQTAIHAYYQSDAGRKALGYKGDTAIHHFTGCTHADHKAV